MTRAKRNSRWLVSVCLALSVAAPVGAQQAADPEQTAAALARAKGLLRQIGEQKIRLEAENAQLGAELAGLRSKLSRTEAKLENTALDLESSERQNERNESAINRLKERLDKTTERLREFVDRYKTTSQTLAKTEYEKSGVETQLAQTRAELADAEKKNLALYTANREILGLYAGKTAMDSILQREPFTGIKNVEIENILEQYQYEMYDEVRDSNLEAARAINAR